MDTPFLKGGQPGGKMLKNLICFMMVPALILLSGCGAMGKEKQYDAQFLSLFDTVTEVTAYARSEKNFEKQVKAMKKDLEQYHQLYDIYNDYDGINNIKTINDNAGIKPVEVESRIISLLKFGKEAYEITGGKVNIAFGSVLSVWHDYRAKGIDDPKHAELPPMEVLSEAAKHTDINNVVIDEAASTVYLADEKMSLDVGSIGKGYAAEQVCVIAQKRGMETALVSLGGNIRAIGGKNDGKPWKVGIQNPKMESEEPYIAMVKLDHASIVTSGDYQRYYTVSGKQYHHIIDPETLMPAAYFTSVSILCEDSGMADALSTAVYNMPLEEGKAFIDSLDFAEAMWVFPDGRQEYSSGFENYLAEK